MKKESGWKRITFEDVCYDTRGFPHKKMRYGFIKNRRLRLGRGVTGLPKGWTWEYKKKSVKKKRRKR